MIWGQPDVDLTLVDAFTELGGRFRGRLVRAPQLDDRVDTGNSRTRGVRLRLRYRTEGRGSTDRVSVDEATFPADNHGRIDSAFELAVPAQAPVSYDGTLIRVIWEIQVTVDIKHEIDDRGAAPVLVLPTNGYGIYQAPHPLRQRTDQ